MDQKRKKLTPETTKKKLKLSTPDTTSHQSNLNFNCNKEVVIQIERLSESVVAEMTAGWSAIPPEQSDVQKECQDAKITDLERKLDHMENKLKLVIAELKQVKEEQARSELESKIEKYKEQCTELQSENEKLQRENERLQKYLQDLESANINVEEKSQINLYNTDLNSQITKVMNSRYPQTSNMSPPPGIPRDYAYGPYILAPNNTYPLSTTLYPASFNSRYPKSFSYPASCNSPYHSSASPYPTTSTKYYPASGSIYPAISTNRYPTSSNSPHHAPTSASPCSSNRHYPVTNSSYSGPTSMNQPSGASPYPLMGSRCCDSRFGPRVNETNDDVLNINSLPNEIILKVFSYLTQNQLGQIARVCRRWNVLTKSPVLWRKVNVKIFTYVWEKNAKEQRDVIKSFINGLPSCVTFIRLDFQGFAFFKMDFEELCVKLHQNCPHLEVLILTDLRMSNLLSEVINFCSQFLQCVKKLVFLYCHFSKSSRTVELNDNSKIEVLDLYRCDISRVSKTQFSKLLYLKELHLAVANVDDTWFLDDASFFNRLNVLNLGRTYITASTFLAIQRHGHNLKELYLCNFKLLDHDLNFNKSAFPRLKTICLGSYDITCEVVVSLIQSCPSLQNVYVDRDVAESFAAHPFVVANRCESGIVKGIGWRHNHKVDYSHN